MKEMYIYGKLITPYNLLSMFWKVNNADLKTRNILVLDCSLAHFRIQQLQGFICSSECSRSSIDDSSK